jgi:hypothetical protein
MAETQVPYSWVGQRIVAGIVEVSGYGQYGAPLPQPALHRVGTLDSVNELGILATLEYVDPEDEEEGEPHVRTFLSVELGSVAPSGR